MQSQLKYLGSKQRFWDTQKLVYEFGRGYSASKWQTLVESDHVEVLKAVFKLLLSPEIIGNEDSLPMTGAFLTAKGLSNLSTFLHSGDLSGEAVDAAVEARRGSSQWKKVVKAYAAFFSWLGVLMKSFPESKTNSTLQMITEALMSRVAKLCPPIPSARPLDEEGTDSYEFMEPWLVGTSEESKSSCVGICRDLFRLCEFVEALQNSGRSQKRLRQQEENARKARSGASKPGFGSRFQDDPEDDSDFMSARIVPTPDDLLSSGPVSLPQNLVFRKRSHYFKTTSYDNSDTDEDDADVDDAADASAAVLPAELQYRNFHHYLNTHFALLQEDCVAVLRRSVRLFRDRTSAAMDACKPPLSNVSRAIVADVAAKIATAKSSDSQFNIYLDMTVEALENTFDGLGFVVSFSVAGKSKVRWEKTSRFMNGSLLCLSCDGSFSSESIILATVLKSVSVPAKVPKDWKPTVVISIDGASLDRFNSKLTYVAIETSVFFGAYKPVLQSLQSLGNSSLEFWDLLMGKSLKVDPPSYLNSGSDRRAIGWDLSSFVPSLEGQMWNPFDKKNTILPQHFDGLSLDPSQRSAITLALSKKLAIIQGPPGCGKTFVGVLITKILLANAQRRSPRPILFVCQTNHALDQILEHVYTFEKNIIRVGGRSQSAIMQSLNLTNVKKTKESLVKRTAEEWDVINDLNSYLERVKADCSQMSSSVDNISLCLLPNNVLARLWKLLKCFGRQDWVEAMFSNAPVPTHKRVHDNLCQDYNARKKSKNQVVPAWLLSFDAWMALPLMQRLFLLAAYPPHNTKSSKAEQLLVQGWVGDNSKVALLSKEGNAEKNNVDGEYITNC